MGSTSLFPSDSFFLNEQNEVNFVICVGIHNMQEHA